MWALQSKQKDKSNGGPISGFKAERKRIGLANEAGRCCPWQHLMAISGDARITNTAHVPLLPPPDGITNTTHASLFAV